MDGLGAETRQPLAPSRSSTLNSRHDVSQEYRKRKRDSIDSIAGPEIFDAVILSTSAARASITFSPVTSVLRAHVPLAWLGGNAGPDSLAPGTVIQASITTVSRWDYHVLIARHIPNGAMYAIERVEEDVFVCHALRNWIRVEWIQQAAIGASPPVDINLLLKSPTPSCHFRKPSTSSISSLQQIPTAPPSPRLPKNRRGMLARQSILMRDAGGEEHESMKPLSKVDTSYDQAGAEQASDSLAVEQLQQTIPDLRERSPHEPLSNPRLDNELQPIVPNVNYGDDAEREAVDHLSAEYLRKRYFETLYLSKTSLAFYAKGPLSRTRARIRASRATISPHQLAEYYREMILPTKKMDIKYKESIKNMIMTLPPTETIDLEVNDEQSMLACKPKKVKKLKLGKNALWPTESEFVEKWWRNRDWKPSPGCVADGLNAELQTALSRLRMRETEMQIILILEIISLESMSEVSQVLPDTPSEPNLELQSGRKDPESGLGKPPAAKKKRDLKSELEGLLDKLCIWQSVETDHSNLSPQKEGDAGQSTSANMKDRLRDFCKDVVVPFYSSKVSEQCRMICKKFGGSELSPMRPNIAVEKLPAKVLPGTAVNPRARPTSKRTLEKVMSEDHGADRPSPPLLFRASTLPSMPVVKREPSERPMSRAGLHKSVSFTNREIDLVADAKLTAAKRRKLEVVAAQKRELDAAIEALKKPNRSVAGKDFMDNLEKRNRDTKPSAKRVEPIQITATPKHARSRPTCMDEYELPPVPFMGHSTEHSFIPSSTTKGRRLNDFPSVVRASATKEAVLSAIHDTPSRQQLRSLDQNQSSAYNGSALDACHDKDSDSTLVNSTPATCRLRTDLYPTTTTTPSRIRQPCKASLFSKAKSSRTNEEHVFDRLAEIPPSAAGAMERVMTGGQQRTDESIYESLGWTDDYDL